MYLNAGMGTPGDVVYIKYTECDGKHVTSTFLVTQPGVISVPYNTHYCEVNNIVKINLPMDYND